MRYVDRISAGRMLAAHVARVLPHNFGSDAPLVLGIPRGGVIVAAVVAEHIGGELNVAVARKVRSPGNPELAIGAVGETGDAMLMEDLIAELTITDDQLERLVKQARLELQQGLSRYRKAIAAPVISGRVVVVVDDGVATGATLGATLQIVRAQRPEMLIGAVPVGAPDSVSRLSSLADEVVCPVTPRWFRAVGEWYEEFTQVDDDEVTAALE